MKKKDTQMAFNEALEAELNHEMDILGQKCLRLAKNDKALNELNDELGISFEKGNLENYHNGCLVMRGTMFDLSFFSVLVKICERHRLCFYVKEFDQICIWISTRDGDLTFPFDEVSAW